MYLGTAREREREQNREMIARRIRQMPIIRRRRRGYPPTTPPSPDHASTDRTARGTEQGRKVVRRRKKKTPSFPPSLCWGYLYSPESEGHVYFQVKIQISRDPLSTLLSTHTSQHHRLLDKQRHPRRRDLYISTSRTHTRGTITVPLSLSL